MILPIDIESRFLAKLSDYTSLFASSLYSYMCSQVTYDWGQWHCFLSDHSLYLLFLFLASPHCPPAQHSCPHLVPDRGACYDLPPLSAMMAEDSVDVPIAPA